MTQYTRRGQNITRLGGTTKTRSATVHLLLKNSALATNVPYRGAHIPSSIRRNQCIDQKPNQPSRHTTTCHAEQTQCINHTHTLPHQTPVPNHNPKGGDCQVAPFYCLSQDGWLKLLDSAHVTSQPRKKKHHPATPFFELHSYRCNIEPSSVFPGSTRWGPSPAANVYSISGCCHFASQGRPLVRNPTRP
jgi:hypothetical protein